LGRIRMDSHLNREVNITVINQGTHVFNCPLFQRTLGRAWRAIIALKTSRRRPAAIRVATRENWRSTVSCVSAVRDSTARRNGGTSQRRDATAESSRGGRGSPERTHREMLAVVGVDCERRLWLVLCAGRTVTGFWQPNRGWYVCRNRAEIRGTPK